MEGHSDIKKVDMTDPHQVLEVLNQRFYEASPLRMGMVLPAGFDALGAQKVIEALAKDIAAEFQKAQESQP